MTAEKIINLIRRARIDLSSEKRAQSDIEYALATAGFGFKREYELSKSDVVDFLIGSIALELKLRGSQKMDIYRQLKRYAIHPEVSAIILASNVSMGLPVAIEDKDCYFVKMGEAWL